MKVYKFVKWDVEPLESLKNSEIYKTIESAEKGDLSLLKELYNKSYPFQNSLLYGYYDLLGWRFDVKDFCNKYLVRMKYHNSFIKYFAPNKTVLYNALGGRHNVEEIYQIGIDVK